MSSGTFASFFDALTSKKGAALAVPAILLFGATIAMGQASPPSVEAPAATAPAAAAQPSASHMPSSFTPQQRTEIEGLIKSYLLNNPELMLEVQNAYEAKMEKVQPELLVLIERSLSADADLTATEGMSSSGGPAAVASVLNYVASSLEKVLLDGVSTMDQGLCDQIKNLMFVFEDIVQLDDRAVQAILKEVDMRELGTALKGVSPSVTEKVFRNMSERAVNMLKEDMEFMGPVRLKVVEEAQQKVVGVIRRLEEAGELTISRGGEEEVLV